MAALMRKLTTYSVVALATLTSACSYDSKQSDVNTAGAIVSSDVPLVSGNTFDYWNRLDKFSPEAMTINISYRYIYDRSFPLSLPETTSAKSWMFPVREKPVPDRLLMITVRQDIEESKDPSGRILVFGRHQFVSEVSCVSKSDTDIQPELTDYAKEVWAKDPEISDDLILFRYIGGSQEEDGSRLEIVHAEDIVRSGYSCTDLGDLESPNEETKLLIEKFRENSERSFEVIG